MSTPSATGTPTGFLPATTISTQAYKPRAQGAGPVARPVPVPAETQHEIEQFLFFEAQLLDEARHSDWLDLLTDDVRYRMPARRNRLHRDLPTEAGGAGDFHHYDDDRATLGLRTTRVQQPTAWSDNPPPRIVRVVGNVQAEELRVPAATAAEYRVRSVVTVYRNRLADDHDSFTGFRVDRLRRVEGVGLMLAERTVYLADSVVLAKNAALML